MRISELQEFLRSLAPLAAVGVASKPLADLRIVAAALEPFHWLDLEQFGGFLRRAEEHERAGAVPTAVLPGIDAIGAAARELERAIQVLEEAEPEAAKEREASVVEARKALQAAIGQASAGVGSSATFKDNKTWLPGLRQRAMTRQLVAAVRGLAARITSSESYRQTETSAEIDRIAGADEKTLKAAAVELGAAPGRKKGRDALIAMLVHLTGIEAAQAKPARKSSKPAAGEEQVQEMIRSLQEFAAQGDRTPEAVSEADVEAALGRLKANFSGAQQKEIAKAVTGAPGKSAADAALRIRARLIGVKQILESQNV